MEINGLKWKLKSNKRFCERNISDEICVDILGKMLKFK